ncbi:MAG: pyruvate, phosphate dikinase [Promethearchaeota archaeon]
MSEKKYVYMFSECNANLKEEVGEKGANLAEMTNLSLPVPPGFIISCPACINFFENPDFLEEIKPEIEKALKKLENITSKKFGNINNPLLVSVRSSAPVSMPGMLDSCLNVGLNEKNLIGLKNKKNEKFALDTYRRFIQIFSDIVIGIDESEFNQIYNSIKKRVSDNAIYADLSTGHFQEIINQYKKLYRETIGEDFPTNPKQQLYSTIKAVFNSWNRPRAKYYRKINNIPNYGTAVIIQEMVFGNLDNNSMTGVAFTRDPSTGAKKYMGEYLIKSQGDDVNSSVYIPTKLFKMETEYPKIFVQLVKLMKRLENHFKDMQGIEFTVQNGKLYALQTRAGKRTPMASVKIAVDMMKEGLINREETIQLVNPSKLIHFLFKRVDEENDTQLISTGTNASPGAITGKIVFNADTAKDWTNKGENVILCRPHIRTNDIHGIIAAKGILTVFGGKTSPVIITARSMGKPAVCGANDIFMDIEKNLFWVEGNSQIYYEGDLITIDGSSGYVYKGSPNLIEPNITAEFKELLKIADEIRVLGVRANAETSFDLKKAVEFGAEGIGLCRTEHMFMSPERLPIMREMIVARSSEERREALLKIRPMQKEDFKNIFRIMDGKPVTVRLLDPPLYEFLPDIKEVYSDVQLLRYRKYLGEDINKTLKEKEELLVLVDSFFESNLMLGLRGCRLGIIWPEIYDMQIEALIEAACELKRENIKVIPEIMIPLVSYVNEFKIIRKRLSQIADGVKLKYKIGELKYKIGVLIEVPRVALDAEAIAEESDFFSFGSNDLTQMSLAFSRNDAEHKFLLKYLEKGILEENPFEVIDIKGVGRLIKLAIEGGRKTKQNLECGICGEHGGEPKSIEFCHQVDLDYISCSSFQVPTARLAAAQAQLKYPRVKKTKKT